MTGSTRVDLGTWTVVIIGIATALVLLIGAHSIAPPLFDPVGSAALPQACAWGLLACVAGLFSQAWMRFGIAGAHRSSDPVRVATLGIGVLMVLCVLAMTLGLGFKYSTILFVAFAVPIISQTWRSFPVAIGIAVFLGFGAEWLFTSVFFIDLPSAR